MARSKLQWRAEKKRAAQRAVPARAELLRIKAEHPQLVAAPVSWAPEAPGAPSSAAESAAPASNSTASNGATAVIDLTEEDEEEEDEELPAIEAAGEGKTEEEEAEQALGEDEESDVDEEWPAVQRSGASTPETQELEDDKEENRKEDRELPAPGASAVSSVMDMEEDEMEIDEELPVAAKPPPAGADGGKEAETDWAGRILRIVETAEISQEHLEDGEIFEVGAVATSPASIKRALALERLGSREDSSSDAGSSHSQHHVAGPNKQKKVRKKRGKKKRKRELEMMAAEAAVPGSAPMGFERITRQNALPSAPPVLLSHPPGFQATMGVPQPDRLVQFQPRFPPPPPPIRHVPFAGPPPPPRRLPPHLVPNLNVPPPPPQGLPQYPQHPGFHRHHSDPISAHPPFGGNHIMRINRQGSIEMLSSSGGNVRRPPPPIMAAPPHPVVPVEGGFRYRSIGRPPQPTRVVELIQTTITEDHSGASSPAVSNASSMNIEGNYENSTPSKNQSDDHHEAANDGDLDLALLRAMALRTKRAPRSLPQGRIENASAHSSESADSQVNQPANESDNTDATDINNKSKTDIDELRAEILRSMARKTKKLKMSGVDSSNSAIAKDCSDLLADANTSPQLAEDNVAEACPVSAVQVIPPKVYIEPTPVKASPADSASVVTDAHAAPPTPVIRPLTACTQSLVIRLDDDDLVLVGNDDDNVGLGSPLSSSEAPQNIQSAIDKMRQKIAGLERERAGATKTMHAVSVASSTAGSQQSASLGTDSKANTPGRMAPPSVITTLSKSSSASSTSSPASSSASSSTNPSPAGLQSKIRAMKEQIAAKERERRLRSELLRQAQLKQKAANSLPVAIPTKQLSDTKASNAVPYPAFSRLHQ